jgi:transposase
MQTQSKELNFKGQKIFIGMDVHKKDWKVSIQSEELVYKTFTQKPSPRDLVAHLHRNFPGAAYYSAYEAGFSGFWAHRELVKQGVNNIVVHAADIPTSQKEKVFKTDKRDCRKIARSLSKNELEGIYIPEKKTQEDQSLIRMRLTFRKDLNRQKNRVKSIMNLYGIAIPECFLRSSHWSKSFIEWLKQIKFEYDTAEYSLKILITEVEHLRSSLLEITREIRKLSLTTTYHSDMELLMTIPGIGLITGITFLTHIESIDRFPNTDNFAAYLGLVPNCHSTGDKENTGEMTFRGNKWLRELLVEASWMAARKDPALHLAYLNLSKRMKANQAIIRIARKLSNRIYYVLKNKRPYENGVVQ